MSNGLFPDDRIKSTYQVDFEKLYKKGYRGVLFDIDNTLVPHDAPADDRAKALFMRLQGIGYKVYLVSNNEEPRVKSFAEAVGADGYVYKAGKPLAKGYAEAIRRMGLEDKQVVFFGDQIYTDIWGGGHAGIYTVMVGRISAKEPFHIHLKRILEAPVVFLYILCKAAGGAKRPVPVLEANTSDGR